MTAGAGERVRAEARPTVRRTAEFRALVRDWRAGLAAPAAAPAPTPAEDAPAGPAPPAPPASSPAEHGSGSDRGPLPHAQPFRLRRDGARPLLFRGTVLAAGAAPMPEPGLRGEVALYLVEDGGIAIRAALLAEEGAQVRAQHRAALVADAAGLADFLGTLDPAASLPDPALSGDPPAQVPARAAALRDAFRRLAGTLCTALP